MIRNYAAAAAMAALCACTPTYVGTPYVAGADRIERVAILDDSVPEGISAHEVASLGSNFGLIGALVEAGVQDSRQNALEAALATIGFDAEDTLERYVVEALGQQDIQATVVSGPQRRNRVFVTDYPQAPAGTQAYYDIVLRDFGYVSAGAGQPWRPTADAMVRLVSAADGQVLLENRIAYNVMEPPRGVITIAPDPQYIFYNRAEMTGDPERLANGLRHALQQVASTAATLIR